MIPAVVLAAGKSTRMGRTKALLPVGPDTFLSRIVRTFHAAGVDDLVVVLGHNANEIASDLEARASRVRVVINRDYESGQFSSLLAGLRAIDRPGVAAMLLTLVDVPLVSVDTVRAVIDRYRTTGAAIVRPVSGSRHGHPVLIDRRLFAALQRVDPAVGAKAIVRAHASPAGDVETSDEGAFRDVDTPDEYDAIRLLT
jgi:CTP:molybdopterin cytidylyltransferase MocA